MAIQRWDPQRDLVELQQRMNRMFEDTLSRSVGADDAGGADAAAFKPPIDLLEEPSRYVLRADLPGVVASDVEIKVDNGVLHLFGMRRIDEGVSREAYLRVERPHGRFSAQVSLPPSVEQSAIEAQHRNGVIEIVLPKKKDATPSRIDIASR